MKKGIILSLFVLLALTINTGCSKLDVTKDIDFEIEVVINSTTADFDDVVLLDADSASSAISDYGDKITKIEVTEATFQVTAFNGPSGQKIVSSTLTVADENGGGAEVIGTITDQDISTMPGPLPLTLNQAGIDRFAALIKNSPHKARCRNYGSADSAPIDFTVVFKLKVKMTANPL